MSYQVIARKYRPQRFDEVVGQEHVTRTLANAVLQNRIAHAYLFCGPRGTGKTTIARIFAKCLNCTGGPKADFDESDPRCREITEGRSLDVLEIDGASNNGVEQVRELRDTCRYAPASGKFKIYIIDEVHMLSTAAFNALLKTLEEPPEHVKFMFATTDPEKVLPTILSRCQRFDLRRIPTALIVKHLKEIARRENVDISDAALFAIARGAEGGMRDAESTLDQLISFCGREIQESDVLSMFGLAAQGQILSLADALLDAQAGKALREFQELARNGKDLGRLLADLLNHFRNLLIHQISGGDLSLVEVSEAEAESLARRSNQAPPEILTRMMEVLTDTEVRLRDAASKKILIEVALLKTVEARKSVSLDAVLRQLQQLRGQSADTMPPAAVEKTAPAAPARTPYRTAAQPPAAAIVAETSPPPPAAAPSGLAELWPRLLEGVGRASQFARSYLGEAHPVSFANQVLTIGFDPEFSDHLALVDNPKNHALIQTKLKEMGCGVCQVRFIKAEAPADWDSNPVSSAPEPDAPSPATASAPPPPPASAPKAAPSAARAVKKETPPAFDKESFRNDPLIKQALEIFKGRIVDARG